MNFTKPTCLLLAILFLNSCGSNPPPTIEPSTTPLVQSTDPITRILIDAEAARGDVAINLYFSALEQLLARGDPESMARASEVFSGAQLKPDSLNSFTQLSLASRMRYAATAAEISLYDDTPAQALAWLSHPSIATAQQSELPEQLLADLNRLRGNSYFLAGDYSRAIGSYIDAFTLSESDQQQEIQDNLWSSMQHITETELQSLAGAANSYQLLGWIELARVMERNSSNLKQQLAALSQWRRVWARHYAAALLPSPLLRLEQNWQQRPRKLALMLPITDAAGLAIQEGFFSAYYEDLTIDTQVPEIRVYNTAGVNDILPIYEDAINDGADLVIGPLSKPHVTQLHQLGELPVTTLALNYADTEPRRADGSGTSSLFQLGLAPEDEIEQVSAMAWDSGLRNAAILVPAGSQRLSDHFEDLWEQLGGELVATVSYGSGDDYGDIIKRLMAIDESERRAREIADLLPRSSVEFIPRRRQDIDFIMLIANASQGRQLKPTLAFYYAGDVPVYARPSINDGRNDPATNGDLDGIVFTEAPWILTEDSVLKQTITANLRPGQGDLERLRALGIDAYRLYSRLQQLAAGEIEAIDGVTGELQLLSDLRFRRSLTPATFRQGQAIPLSASPP